MSAWILVPCLAALRGEFNRISPGRDKGADGSIGDSAHTSSSDHTPDEDSDVLRDHDADSKNEVHALDIDSTGPWPAGRSFASIVATVIAGEKVKWLSATDVCRLEYVIWDRRIYSRKRDFEPITYTGPDPHTNHAHFSSRYLTTSENDTRPWGVAPIEEEPVALQLNQDDLDAVGTACINAVKYVLNNDAATITNLKARPWQYILTGTDLPAGTSILNHFSLMYARVAAITAALPQLADDVDEQALAQAVADRLVPILAPALSAELADSTVLTEDEAQAAAERAVRKVLGQLDTPA